MTGPAEQPIERLTQPSAGRPTTTAGRRIP
jgi:hypothetical protein